jgi:flagellar basal-body rod modification protein FlgD
MSAITSNTISQSTTTSSTTPSTPKNDLDKNAFLKLLVTQLKYQDPLQPADNTQFIAQLAQFSALEQMNNVAEGMNKVQQTSSFGAAVQLIGAHVTATGADGQTVEGTVSGLQMADGVAKVSVNGQLFDLSQIVSVNR